MKRVRDEGSVERCIPFRNVNGKVRHIGGTHLVLHFLKRQGNHIFQGVVGVVTKDLILRVIGVNVCTEEIEWDVIFGAVFDEVRRPGCLCRRGSAHAQSLIDRFQSGGCVAIEIKILLLRSRPKVNVGLIPNLKKPAAEFGASIAEKEVTGERGDHFRPSLNIFGRGYVGLVPEDRFVAAREKLGHKAESDKGSYANFEQTVVNLIDVLKVINDVAARSDAAYPDIVSEDAMEAHGIDADFLVNHLEIFLIVSTQRQNRSARANHGFPVVWKGAHHTVGINGE